jgi:spermidine synthase
MTKVAARAGYVEGLDPGYAGQWSDTSETPGSRREEEPVPSTTIARAVTPRGELVLRRRDWDGELELRVNGVFVMDSYETATERALAVLALDSIAHQHAETDDGEGPAPLTVLVGGLGLGYTVAQFASSPLVSTLIVAEIEADLVAWHRAGMIPLTERLVHDSRIQLVAADIRDVVAGQPPRSVNAIVLDVDNGPGYLVYDANAPVYESPFLVSCREALVRKGIVVVWSAAQAPELAATLEQVFGSVSLHAMAVRRGDRDDHYYAYVAPARPDRREAADDHDDQHDSKDHSTHHSEHESVDATCPGP